MKPKYVVILILVALAVIFIVQNSEMVPIKLFFWTISMSRIIMIGGLMLIGFIVGFLLGRGERRSMVESSESAPQAPPPESPGA